MACYCLVKRPRVFCCKCDADAAFDLMEGAKKLGTFCERCGTKALKKLATASSTASAPAKAQVEPCQS